MDLLRRYRQEMTLRIAAAVRSQWLADERVLDAQVAVTFADETLRIEGFVESSAGPFRLVIAVGSVTSALLVAADRPAAISAATAALAGRLVAAIDRDVAAAREGTTQALAAAALGVDVTALRRRGLRGPRSA